MGRRDKGKKKAVCQGSDVFTMFEKGQLQEFKEAFEMIDSNRDGFIDKNDLKSTYMSLGVRNVEDADIDKMMAEAPGALNFTTFLNMLAEKLHGTDPEDVMIEAFKVLDPSGCGKIHSGDLIEALTCEASRFSKDEVDALMDFAPVDVSGFLDYKALCYIITHGQEEE
jgi:Ca2+-binding EF-hand superfamily protein